MTVKFTFFYKSLGSIKASNCSTTASSYGLDGKKVAKTI
ncbi:protein of unknown function [Tenacibaculum aestuariivivum]